MYIYIASLNLLQYFRKNSSSYAWHGLNQSYDSLVNFTNRNGDTKFIPTTQFRYGVSVLAATITSTLAAFHIERFLLSKICHPIHYVIISINPIIFTRYSIKPSFFLYSFFFEYIIYIYQRDYVSILFNNILNI